MAIELDVIRWQNECIRLQRENGVLERNVHELSTALSRLHDELEEATAALSNAEVYSRQLNLDLQHAIQSKSELELFMTAERERVVSDLKALAQYEAVARQNAEREMKILAEEERTCRLECISLREQLENAKHGHLPSNWPTVQQLRGLLQQTVIQSDAQNRTAEVAHYVAMRSVREGVLALQGELGEISVMLMREHNAVLGLEQIRSAIEKERDAALFRIMELEVSLIPHAWLHR